MIVIFRIGNTKMYQTEKCIQYNMIHIIILMLLARTYFRRAKGTIASPESVFKESIICEKHI
jgi:hypothetical protein